jgi:hypothetical protein
MARTIAFVRCRNTVILSRPRSIPLPMNRFQAAGIHLGLSLIVATLVGCLIYFLWYPPPYFQVSGGNTLMLLIMGVDIVIGPLLTLVVYKAGKKSLRFDLACIGVLQICAFAYGLSVIVRARPVFVVAALDRFIPIYANALDDADLAQAQYPEFAQRSWRGPRLVGAVLPTDTRERNAITFSGVAGKDLEKFPRYYVPYAQVADAMLARARPLAALAAKSPANAGIIARFVADRHLAMSELAYLPLAGRTESYTMIVSSADKKPIGAVAIDPW